MTLVQQNSTKRIAFGHKSNTIWKFMFLTLEFCANLRFSRTHFGSQKTDTSNNISAWHRSELDSAYPKIVGNIEKLILAGFVPWVNIY